jgi:hypothetical protein
LIRNSSTLTGRKGPMRRPLPRRSTTNR